MITDLDPASKSTMSYNDAEYVIPLDMGTTESTCGIDFYSYVDSQFTDNHCDSARGTELPILPNAPVTPNRSSSSIRPPSLVIGGAQDSYTAGPSSASSFDSSPGYLTPSSSASSALSSRRRSSYFAETQRYHTSAGSPSPMLRSRRPNAFRMFDQYQPQEAAIVNVSECFSNETSFVGAADLVGCNSSGSFLAVNECPPIDQVEICQPVAYYGNLPENHQFDHMPFSTTFTPDLVSNFRGFVDARQTNAFQTSLDSQQPIMFKEEPQQSDEMTSQITMSSIVPSLQPPFDESMYEQNNNDTSSSEDDKFAAPTSSGSRRFKSSTKKEKRTRRSRPVSQFHGKSHPSYPLSKEEVEKAKAHHQAMLKRCQAEGCNYACPRREHLNRHFNSHHNPDRTEFTCEFPDCIDKKTGKHRIIVSRNDNYKAHYQNTHFSYGASEKGGKNRRKSMKESLTKGTRDVDYRWDLMLEGNLDMVSRPKVPKGVWKMIGYSIRETREIKVKDIKPDFPGPDDTRLEKLDFRWKAIKDGTLTYEQAMSIGVDMPETTKQGLLGIDMLESEAMGLRPPGDARSSGPGDPRWKLLDSGGMSIEESEKLGVKHQNPRWTRMQKERK